LLLSDLGVTKTHGRPHTSNDNPYSESQFKTLKYRPEFPKRFGSIEDSRGFCRTFFSNGTTRSTVIPGLPFIHLKWFTTGGQRQEVLDAAYQQHPERFVKKPPATTKLPEAVWINKPTLVQSSDKSRH